MNKDWINIRLNAIDKRLSVLETILFNISNNLDSFIGTENPATDISLIIYGQENIEGSAMFLTDLRNDIKCLCEQIEEKNADR